MDVHTAHFDRDALRSSGTADRYCRAVRADVSGDVSGDVNLGVKPDSMFEAPPPGDRPGFGRDALAQPRGHRYTGASMARVYDTSFKELVTHHFASLLPWLLPGVHEGEVVRLSEELPATLRRADLIVRSERDGSPPTLFLVECQCQQDADLPLDMLLRAALAHRQYKLPVETVLLAFTPQAAVADEYLFGGKGERTSRHFVNVRRIFEEPAEAALAMDIIALLPLVSAMRPADGNRAALLSSVLELIVDRVSPDAQRSLMLDQAATFATLHLSRLQVQGIVREVAERRKYMLDPIRDFPWLRHGYEQGIEKGKEQGMAESVLAFLAARNIAVDDILRQKILTCQDQARLKKWITRAATATSAAEVMADS